MDNAAIALAEAASTIYAAAQNHKRAIDHHRKQLRLLMEEFDRACRACAAAGITVEITHSPGRHSGRGNTQSEHDR